MLKNIDQAKNLRSLARVKSRDYETKTVNLIRQEEMLADGWLIDKKNKKSVRFKKIKTSGVRLEDRVWTLLWKMEFRFLSCTGGANLLVNPKEVNSPSSQVDVVGIDDEIALAVECKSQEKFGKWQQFQEKLGKHALIRERFAHSINKNYQSNAKRQIVLAFFTSNISLSENDKLRAKEANVLLFDDQDLAYYENLVSHLGPAAKYQFFADMLPGKPVPGLAIRVPAIRTKMGGTSCYSFSISPKYLLKISYVSHRQKGKASDVHTYQRMLIKSRLNKIKQYISEDGIFPTNIVVNLEAKRLFFERIQQAKESEQTNGVLGWLDIKPAYKSAWIIDGQHRLFAYSGHEKAEKSLLSVIAFEGLLPSKQAGLFIDINAKQKSVKQSLLQTLYAELHWDAEKPQIRVRAIISKAVQDLDADIESPFFQRIQTADAGRDEIRCISLTSIYGAIERVKFHIAKEKHEEVVEYGPLWAGTNDQTLKRTVFILSNWFKSIRTAALDWWDKGAGDGGGLAMNDGIISCINVLRSVFDELESSGKKLVQRQYSS